MNGIRSSIGSYNQSLYMDDKQVPGAVKVIPNMSMNRVSTSPFRTSQIKFQGPNIVPQPTQIQYITTPANHSDCNDLISQLNAEVNKLKNDQYLLFQDKDQLLRILSERDQNLAQKDSRIVYLENAYAELSQKEQTGQMEHENTKKHAINQGQYMDLEINKLRELLQQRDQAIDQQRSQLGQQDVEIRRLQGVEFDNQRLRELCDRLRQDGTEWQNKYMKIEQEMYKLGEYERKTAILTEEIERLNNVLKLRLEDLEQWRAKFAQLEIERNQLLKVQMENNNLKDIIELREKSLNQMRSEQSRLEQRLLELSNVQALNKELQNKIIHLTQGIENLNKQLKSRDEQIHEFSIKHNNLAVDHAKNQEQHEQTKKSAHVKHSNMSMDNESLSRQLQQARQEIDEWKMRYQKLDQRCVELQVFESKSKELENRVYLLTTELDRIQGTLKQRVNEIEELKTKLYQSEHKDVRIREGDNRIKLLTDEIERLNNILRLRLDEIESWKLKAAQGNQAENKCTDLTGRINLLTNEIDRLNQALKFKVNEMDEMRSKLTQAYQFDTKNQALMAENERLKHLCVENNREIESWKTKYIDYSNNLDSQMDKVKRSSAHYRQY